MRSTRLTAAVVGSLVAVASGVLVAPGPVGASGRDADRLSWGARLLGRQVLPANDGWAAAGPGTTGGSAAAPDQAHVVETRAELIAALGGDNATNATNATPKIIYVKGTIDGFEVRMGGC